MPYRYLLGRYLLGRKVCRVYVLLPGHLRNHDYAFENEIYPFPATLICFGLLASFRAEKQTRLAFVCVSKRTSDSISTAGTLRSHNRVKMIGTFIMF